MGQNVAPRNGVLPLWNSNENFRPRSQTLAAVRISCRQIANPEFFEDEHPALEFFFNGVGSTKIGGMSPWEILRNKGTKENIS